MPSNRFDTSQPQEYVSQHVPLPFEAIAALGEKTQKAHDAAIDDTYKLKDLMTKVPAIYDPNLGLSNIQKKKELDAQFAPKIDDLTNKIMAGDVNATRELEQLKRDFANNPVRQELENSYVDYQAYKKDMMDKKDAYAVYKDPYRNKALINEAGELQPFRYSGMGEKQDHATEARAQMSDIAKMGYDSKNSYLDPKDGNIYTKGSNGKYIKDERVRQLANMKADKFIQTQKGQDYLQLLHYQNPKATPQELMQGVSDYLYAAGANQVFQDVGGMSDVQVTSMSGDIRKEKQEFAGPMPTYQNPLATTGTTLTPKSGLGWLGINTNSINDDGTVNHRTNIDSKYIVTKVDGTTSTYYTSQEAHKEAGNTGIITQQKTDKGEQQQNLIKFYNDLLTTARGLGLEIPKKSNDKSKTDFDELQKQLSKYGQNMQEQGNTSAGLQSRFGNNLSNELLGTVTAKDDGTTVFKKSPLLGGAKIVDQSTGEVISENKEEVAKDGAIRGINYFAPEAGTYRMDSKNKAYNYNPGDNTLNKMTQNTHGLTQDIIKARQGKQNSKTIIDSDNNTVGDYANNIVNSLKENFKTIPANNPQGMMLANHLNENLTKLNGYEPVSVKTSDILIQEGPRRGSPKYNYVAYEHKGFGTTNEADDKILRVDAESGQTEIMTLGDIHASERDYLQQNYAGAFEPTK